MHALDTALPGADLTEMGRSQAADVGRILAGRCERPLHVMSSQAARAQQTAILLADSFADAGGSLASAGVASDFGSRFAGRDLASLSDATATSFGSSRLDFVSTLQGISEIPAGDYEMRNDEDAHEAYQRVLGAWLSGEVDVPVPGGATGSEVLAGYVPQLLAVMRAVEGADVAVVSHGAIIRFVARFLGAVDPEWAFTGYLANTHFVALDIPPNIAEVAEAIEADFSAAEGAFDVLEWGLHGRPNNQLR